MRPRVSMSLSKLTISLTIIVVLFLSFIAVPAAQAQSASACLQGSRSTRVSLGSVFKNSRYVLNITVRPNGLRQSLVSWINGVQYKVFNVSGKTADEGRVALTVGAGFKLTRRFQADGDGKLQVYLENRTNGSVCITVRQISVF